MANNKLMHRQEVANMLPTTTYNSSSLKTSQSLNDLQTRQGFTLIEMIVAVGVFAVAAVLMAGAYVSVNSYWRTSINKEEAVNEMRLALDLLSTEISFGSALPNNCENGCNTIRFATQVRTDTPLKTVEYKRDSTGAILLRGELKTSGVCSSIPLASECFSPLTSERLRVNNLKFFVENLKNDRHPLVTIVVEGTIAPGSAHEEAFSLSTSATPRSGQIAGTLPPSDISAPTVTITSPTTNTTHTTSNASVTLGGTASDNVKVISVTWFNAQMSSSGTAVLTPSGGAQNVTWNTGPITLFPSISNFITIVAKDAEGNSGTDQLEVISTAPMPTPEIWQINTTGYYCDQPNTIRARLYFLHSLGASVYEVYRCTGASCSPVSIVQMLPEGPPSNPLYLKADYPTFPGDSHNYQDAGTINANNTFCYQIRARNSTTGRTSNKSTIKCVFVPLQADSCVTRGGGGGGGGGADFSLTASPDNITVKVDGSQFTKSKSGVTKITVSPQSGFSSTVQLQVSSVTPSIPDFQALWDPGTSIASNKYNSGTKFSVRVRNDTLPLTGSSYKIVLTGSGGGKSHTVTVWLRVVPDEGFEE